MTSSILKDSPLPVGNYLRGDNQVSLYLFAWGEATSPEERATVMERMFPEESCHHEHDCCGNMYARAGVELNFDDIYNESIVSVVTYQNV